MDKILCIIIIPRDNKRGKHARAEAPPCLVGAKTNQNVIR